jgi:CRP/FNR family transcriptional regulator, nitrogen fixation regulation protein
MIMQAHFPSRSADMPAMLHAGAAWMTTAPESGNGDIGLPAAPVRHFREGAEICGEGEVADVFFKVVSGVVRTCRFLADGRRQIDAFHVAGDVFGFELGARYSLSAEAVCECGVIAHRRHVMHALAGQDEALSERLLSGVLLNLMRARQHAFLLGRKSASEKVALFLIDWAERCGDRDKVELAMTRQDIADYLGLTIETVSRTFTQFERDGFIELSGIRRIRLNGDAMLRMLNGGCARMSVAA